MTVGVMNWRAYLAWTLGLSMALVGPFLSLLTLPAGADGMLLVVTPPWRDALAVIGDAGGRPIGPEASVLGQFATSDTPDFPDRLRAAGAWVVLDGEAISALCGWEVT